jgi:predicted transcriptional regulator
MKDSVVRVLDEKEELIVDLIEELGFPRIDAILIAYLYGAGEATSRDMEIGGNLRQPEVSRSLRAMKQNGWVGKKHRIKTKKGRPRTVYSLSCSLDEIISDFEQSLRRESEAKWVSIQKLRELSSSEPQTYKQSGSA